MKKRYLAIGSVVFLILFLREKNAQKEVETKPKAETEVLDFGKVEVHNEPGKDTAVVPAVKTEIAPGSGITTTGAGTDLATKPNTATAPSITPTTGSKTTSSPITTDKVVSESQAILNKIDEMVDKMKEINQGEKVVSDNKESDYTKFIEDENRKNAQNSEVILIPVQEEPYLSKVNQLKTLNFVTTQTGAEAEAYYKSVRDNVREVFQPLYDNPTKEIYNEKVQYFSSIVGFMGFGVRQAKNETPHLLPAYVEAYQYILDMALILKEDIIAFGQLQESHFAQLLNDLETFKNWVKELNQHNTSSNSENSENSSNAAATPLPVGNDENDYTKFVNDEARKNSANNGLELEMAESGFDKNAILTGIRKMKAIQWEEPAGLGQIGKDVYTELKTELERKYLVFDNDFTKSDVLNLFSFIETEVSRISKELEIIRNRDLSIVYTSYKKHLEVLYSSVVTFNNID